MKPVTQTITRPGDGNCMAASIASILELPLEDMPNFHGGGWWDRWQEWLAERNLQLICAQADEWFEARGYHILVGKSPRGDYNHAVVCLDGEMVWDPHPDRTGVETRIEYDLFVVLDPAKAMQ